MKFDNYHRRYLVILSEAKDLMRHPQILRFAQDDNHGCDHENLWSTSKMYGVSFIPYT